MYQKFIVPNQTCESFLYNLLSVYQLIRLRELVKAFHQNKIFKLVDWLGRRVSGCGSAGPQWRSGEFVLGEVGGGQEVKCWRCPDREAEGIEGQANGEGHPLPS